MSDTDSNLVTQFAQHNSQDAFTALVDRHLNLVYSAALRQVRSPQLAEEIAQSVFADLATQATRLKLDTILTAWLYQVTRRTAIDVIRRESRRQARERLAAEMTAMNTSADWTQIEPLLDEAMDSLDETDRAAVLLRFFENKSLREVGAALGTSDDAAQKRVSRALDQLREYFGKRGATVAATGLVLIISANAVQAAPVGLAAAISTAAFTGATLATSAIAATTKTIAMSTSQKLIFAGTLAAALGFAIVEAQKLSSAKSQLSALKQTQRELAQSIASDKTNYQQRIADLQSENSRLNKNSTELLRLRNEVTKLRKDAASNNHSAAAKTPLTDPADTPAFQSFSATNRFNLAWGQTAIAGGWTIPSGDRVLILATPSPLENLTQLNLKIKIAQISSADQKSLWNNLQMAEGAAPLAMLMQQADAETLLNKLFQSQSANVHEMQITTESGREAEITSGASEADAGSIHSIPVISDDGKTVDLQMTSKLNFPRIPTGEGVATK